MVGRSGAVLNSAKKNVGANGKGKVALKEKCKGQTQRQKNKGDKDLEWEEEFEAVDDEDSDVEELVKFGVVEEELEQEELFEVIEDDDFMDKVANGLNFGKDCDILDSGDDNSDELRSLQGSDDEVDSRPSFNPETDFNFKKKS
ncbi:uncharacterized protein LOC141594306 [Silene latifolia]|uniref:uncharacterized protein LOC141594306 n=1 Tax=Silene latifolia TaxID=37657 RepID=UPI003D76DB02